MYDYKITHTTKQNEVYDIYLCERYCERGGVIWNAIILGRRNKKSNYGLYSFSHMVNIPICPN